ncbi:MAG: presenilin family intramembrane aspartyl protease [Candidatus Nanoarchaeia archaeon]
MKHNLKITIILLSMFIITQFIGLYVIHQDPFTTDKNINGTIVKVQNPELSFIQPPEIKGDREYNEVFLGVIFAFIIAVSLLFLLTHFNAETILKLWFFVVVIVALFIALFTIFGEKKISAIIALIIVIPLAYIKIYRKEFLIHNITELFVYPGIAAVFVPILNIYTVVGLLIIISGYDMWAVWHSGIMQKMAKYQINKLNVFSGFFVPYASKKVREQVKKLRKTKAGQKKLKKKKFRVNLAILGGGDVIFPIITAGVMLKTLGIYSALLVTLGATLGLGYLFFAAEKKKFYPAMPFITAGIFLGMVLSWLIL